MAFTGTNGGIREEPSMMTLDTIDLEKLQQVGEALSLGVMVLGYELNY